MEPITLIFSFLLALLLSLYGTPLAARVAQSYGIMDVPDGRLKTHGKPTPYMGGVVIYFAFIAPAALVFPFNRELLGILFAGSILLVVGLFDDLKAMTPGTKMLFQAVAVYIVIKSGVIINLLFISPFWNTVLSVIWLLTLINAFNIIDIMDGLATLTALLSCTGILAISLGSGQTPLLALLAVSLGGGLLGFLRFNKPPALIYMGDAGSMFIGLVIGVLVMMGDYSQTQELGFLAAPFLVFFPIWDIVFVSILRLRQGKSPLRGSPDHLALRLRKHLGQRTGATVLRLGLLQALAVAGAVLAVFTSLNLLLGVLAFLLVLALVLSWRLSRIPMP